MPTGKSQDLLRLKKRNHIFNIIINNKDLSKLAIKKRCGYSMTSVISVVEELTRENLITVQDASAASVGRPPQKININPAGGYIIGIDFSRENIFLSVFNIKRERMFSIDKKTEDINTTAEFIDRIAALIGEADIRAKELTDGAGLIGIGIGVPGYIDAAKGSVSGYDYISDYRDAPVKDILEKRFGAPVFLENNVNAMALGYKWLKLGGKAKSLMVLTVRRGVKAALIVDNKLVKGASGYAGEIGKLTAEGNMTYEDILSDYTVVRKYSEINSADEIVTLARQGDLKAIDYLDKLSDCITKLILPCAALINPGEIVLVGAYAGSGYFVNLIKEKTALNITGGNARELGPIGAAGLVIESVYGY